MRHADEVQPFVDDDPGYLRWLTTHPDGYVLNTERNPSPRYLVLHRASCRTISTLPRGATRWTVDYRKYCGERSELEDIARLQLGGEPRPCSFCLR